MAKKDRNLRGNAEYFWNYYKIPMLVAIVVSLIAGSFVVAAATKKESALQVSLFDCHTSEDEINMAEDYMGYANIDRDKYEVLIDTEFMLDSSAGNFAMTSLSRFYADIGDEKLDVCGMLEDDFANYVKTDCFLDLRDYLNADQLDQLEPYLYISGDKVLGIYTEGLSKLESQNCYTDEKAVVGIVYNTEHVENAVDYLLYLAV